jgi:predicted nuclease of restriction endonuclease-like (RecB) superfamily
MMNSNAIANNWSVRELRRAIDSMLFERTGLSADKLKVLEKHRSGSGLKPEDIRNWETIDNRRIRFKVGSFEGGMSNQPGR